MSVMAIIAPQLVTITDKAPVVVAGELEGRSPVLFPLPLAAHAVGEKVPYQHSREATPEDFSAVL